MGTGVFGMLRGGKQPAGIAAHVADDGIVLRNGDLHDPSLSEVAAF